MPADEVAKRRWQTIQRLTAALLAVWFAVTFGVAFYARELSASLFGWPLSFWVAAQGAPLVYLALVGVYARAMRRLDAQHGSTDSH
jgi:putative solute:sodium symporter small subunit